jgi:hypothetical protein
MRNSSGPRWTKHSPPQPLGGILTTTNYSKNMKKSFFKNTTNYVPRSNTQKSTDSASSTTRHPNVPHHRNEQCLRPQKNERTRPTHARIGLAVLHNHLILLNTLQHAHMFLCHLLHPQTPLSHLHHQTTQTKPAMTDPLSQQLLGTITAA